MITLVRRFVVLAAFAFWQGGFTFYASVVVPTGTEVLGSARDQGFITRHVTVYLNIAGGVALLIFLIDNFMALDTCFWRKLARWLSWLGMVATLAILMWLHPQMDQLLDVDLARILERARFRSHHRWYLWIGSVQWGFGVNYLLMTLWSWQRAIAHADAPGKMEPGA